MKSWIKWTMVAVPGTILGMLLTANGPLGSLIWPVPDDAVQPTSSQLPFLIFLDLVQAAAFGFGIAFLVYGYPLIRNLGLGSPTYATLVYIAIGWGLVSWVPHIAMHMSMGAITESAHFWGLIGIDYVFHFTALASVVLFAHFFLRVARGRVTAAAAPNSKAKASTA